jgi:hypothetical protein
MNRNFSTIAAYGKVLSQLCVMACLAIVVLASGQNNQPSPSVRERVAKIVRERLSDGVSMVNGVRVQNKTPPSPEITKEIRECGNAAIPVLTHYLRSESQNERVVAVELLGLLGGSRVVAPLKYVVEKDRSPTLRILALRWLSQAPSGLASPIISKAARTDVDESVRKAARDLLEPSTDEGRSRNSAPFKVMPSPF